MNEIWKKNRARIIEILQNPQTENEKILAYVIKHIAPCASCEVFKQMISNDSRCALCAWHFGNGFIPFEGHYLSSRDIVEEINRSKEMPDGF